MTSWRGIEVLVVTVRDRSRDFVYDMLVLQDLAVEKSGKFSRDGM